MRLPSLCAACCLLFSVLTVIGPAAAAWKEKFYNPKPASGDMILPMPCGGAMVFAKVEIATTDWVDDQAVRLGGEDAKLVYAEGAREQFISGSFSAVGRPGQRHYWIGKYEVSDLQWESLQGECPALSITGRVPKTGVSWFDSVEFAQRYTEWLYKNAIERLPTEDGVPGFMRLPTEAEWEYAARGGAAVSEEVFRARTFPTPEGLNRYAWYQGSDSAGGKLHPTGLLQSNPLGLYDMLGNAEEIILEPFSLTLQQRLHGQAGGFVTKGGHYLTERASVRSAYRREYPHYDADKAVPTHVGTIGFRLVLSSTVMPTHERLALIKEEWKRLAPVASSTLSSTDLERLRRENALLVAQLREQGWQGPVMDEGISVIQVATFISQGERVLAGILMLLLFFGLPFMLIRKRLSGQFNSLTSVVRAEASRRTFKFLFFVNLAMYLLWLSSRVIIFWVWGLILPIGALPYFLITSLAMAWWGGKLAHKEPSSF